ncbi:AT-hook motif nuclear-localized protein 10 [Abeliophyllum distichum]|uniref:AT-hook motif nuclear-localized protein n=1 Tax=Abeliophyllum distichum TaxID=126358 RepID=A0ABD1R0J4_9LAMI
MGERRDSNVSIPKSSEPSPIAPRPGYNAPISRPGARQFAFEVPSLEPISIAPAPIASEVQSLEPSPIAPWPGYNAPISRPGARQFASEVPSSGFTAYRPPPPLPTFPAPRMIIQRLRNMAFPLLESTAVDFSVHFLTINSGEDLCARMAQILNQNGWRGFAVLAAHGSISRVIAWDTVQGLFMTYSGCYQILSLTGLYSIADHRGQRTGGLHISFAGDGVIYDGTLGGTLIAHNRVDVLIATFGPSVQARHMMMHHSGQSSRNRGGPGNTVN